MKRMGILRKSLELKEPKIFKGYLVQNRKIGRLSSDQLRSYVVPWELSHAGEKA